MTTDLNEQKHGGKDDQDHDQHKLVQVTIDTVAKRIPSGHYVVKDLKEKLGVAGELELDLVRPGNKFEPLDDSAEFHVKGGEIFVSHQRRGGSS